jgi:hypothetical protein
MCTFISSQFTNLIFININTLAQLEIDLASSEMVKNSSRPVGDVYDESYKQWLTTIKKGFASGLCPYDLEKLKEDMLRFRANNMSRDKETGLKYLADGPWPLNVASFHHWSSKTVKNPKRDTPKYALVSLAEIVVVSGYRADLLKKSHAARFFRTEIRKILNRNLKELQGSAGLAVQGTGWDFPDGIECKDQHSVETENVDQLLQQHAYVRDGKGGAQEITGLINRIIKQPIALMKPWDPEYAGMVAPEVHEGLQNLFAVRRDDFFQSSHWH